MSEDRPKRRRYAEPDAPVSLWKSIASAIAIGLLAICLLIGGCLAYFRPWEPPPPTTEGILPRIEITERAKATGIEFSGWRVKRSFPTAVYVNVTPRTNEIRFDSVGGRALRVSVYGEDGVKRTGWIFHTPDLKPNETGEAYVNGTERVSRIARIVIDAE